MTTRILLRKEHPAVAGLPWPADGAQKTRPKIASFVSLRHFSRFSASGHGDGPAEPTQLSQLSHDSITLNGITLCEISQERRKCHGSTRFTLSCHSLATIASELEGAARPAVRVRIVGRTGKLARCSTEGRRYDRRRISPTSLIRCLPTFRGNSCDPDNSHIRPRPIVTEMPTRWS